MCRLGQWFNLEGVGNRALVRAHDKISELEGVLRWEKAYSNGLYTGSVKLQTEIAALKDELDTLDITLRAESTKLVAVTQHLYRVQQLTWWQRVSLAIFQPESLWRV